jgi:hypothetical protein
MGLLVIVYLERVGVGYVFPYEGRGYDGDLGDNASEVAVP